MKQLLSIVTMIVIIVAAGCNQRNTKTSDENKTVSSTGLEVTKLKLGFIKLTDCAPLVIAKEKGFFKDEGLSVTLEAQANWKVLLDGVITGQLDGAQMLAGQPLAATIGFGTKSDIVTGYTMDLNGNAVTVSNAVWQQMKPHVKSQAGQPIHPITAEALKPVIQNYRGNGKQFKMGMVFPVSTHNFELRYWLAAARINPGMYTETDASGNIGADVLLSVTPPPQMPSTLQSGTIDGFCVGEPWNQAAVKKGIGVPVVTNYDIWKNCPEKVFGVRKEWATKNPNTHVAIVKALIRAGKWLDDPKNREEAVRLLAKPEYVGADYDVVANSMLGTFEFEKGDKRSMPDFNVFFKHNATYPYFSDAIWFLTQMRRWGQIPEPKSNDWYKEQAQKVYLPDVWRTAASALKAQGLLQDSDIPATDGFKAPSNEFIDHITFDGKDPNAYLRQFDIGNKN